MLAFGRATRERGLYMGKWDVIKEKRDKRKLNGLHCEADGVGGGTNKACCGTMR